MKTLTADQYLAAVRAALADIPEEEREELLEDLPQHFAEVEAESSVPLHERLGPPESYAAELRAAAGIGEGNPFARWRGRTEALRDWLTRFDELFGKILGYPRLRDFLVLLRPGWWVLRGYVVGMLIAGALYGWPGVVPDPEAVVIVLPAIAGSIWLGRRAGSERWQERMVWWVANGFIGIVLFINLETIDSRLGWNDYGYAGYNQPPSPTVIYPLDENGRPVDGVRLYDANGNPVPIGTVPICRWDLPDHPRSSLCYVLPRPVDAASPPAPPAPSSSPAPSSVSPSAGASGGPSPSASGATR